MKIAVDFDGTLATEYWENEMGDFRADRVGDPIPRMIERVRAWLAKGDEVVVFTARLNPEHGKDCEVSKNAILAFCREQFGRELEVTCEKPTMAAEYWDDKAVRVKVDEGTLAVYVEKVDGDPIGEFLGI